MTDHPRDTTHDDDTEVEGHRRAWGDAETSGDDDTEGHRARRADAETSGDDDVEGHGRNLP